LRAWWTADVHYGFNARWRPQAEAA
jgi:hypothetical protein